MEYFFGSTSSSVQQTGDIASTFIHDIYMRDKHSLIAPPLLLCGEVGSGKSVFARAVLAELGVSSDVITASPTFTLMHEYASARGIVYHADLYRIKNEEAFFVLDLDSCAKEGTVIVEWAQSFKRQYYPHPCYVIKLEILDEHKRFVRIAKKSSADEP